MIRAFWFVTTRSFKNRMLSRLRKLRSPRYAVSLVAGLAYLWFVVFRRMVMEPGHGFSAIPTSDLVIDVLSIVALGAMLLVWAFPDQGGGLTFSEAEIQFLFPAPVSRRDLLLYKIIRQQPPILISALTMTLFGFRQSKFVGLWIAFVVMSIYFTMVSLARARLKLAGIGFLARLVITLAVGAGVAALMVRDLHDPLAAAAGNANPIDVMRGTGSLIHSPILRALLWIPRVFAAAVFPKSAVALAVTCVALLAIGFAFFAIGARLNVSFEDASIAISARLVQARAAVRGGRFGNRVLFRGIRAPFHLSGNSGPELAIVWKNLTAALRISIAFLVIFFVIFAAFMLNAAIGRNEGMQFSAAAMGLMLAAFFPFIGSQALRQDLRLDLSRIELLKSYPIRGDRLVLAEIAAPAIIVSVVEIILLTTTAILSHALGTGGRMAFIGTPEFIVIVLLFAIPICATQLLIQNALTILLPGWTMQSPEESRGFAVLGQRLVIFGGNLLVLVVGLVPAAVVFVPLFLLARHFGSNPFVLAISTAPAIAVLVVEIWIAIRFLGSQYEQIDITNEIDAAM